MNFLALALYWFYIKINGQNNRRELGQFNKIGETDLMLAQRQPGKSFCLCVNLLSGPSFHLKCFVALKVYHGISLVSYYSTYKILLKKSCFVFINSVFMTFVVIVKILYVQRS